MLQNTCTFIGNIYKVIDVVMTSNQKKSVRNVLQVRMGKTAEGKAIYEWVPFVAYEANAEMLNSYFKKGSGVIMTCKYHEYKMQDGTYRHEFIVESLTFPPKDYEEQESTKQPEPAPEQKTGYFGNITADEMPF